MYLMAYSKRFETESTGDNPMLKLGEVQGIGYRRIKDNNTGKSIKEDVHRYRIQDKVVVGGIRYQLNATLTEISK